ncbi:MAG: DUF1043 family protein [Deinococcales bacterium]
MNVWLWVAAAFVAGGLVGAGITALLRRGSDTEQRLRRLRREYDLYQGEVARHFTQTGELLSRLRGAFEQLYGEVEDRAEELVGEDALQRRLRDLEGAPEGAPREAAERLPRARWADGAEPERPDREGVSTPGTRSDTAGDRDREPETSVPDEDLRR